MSPRGNICCILTVAVYIASILASPNCKNCLFGKCDEDGICTDGCEPGYADIYCQHPCQETCLQGRCIVDNYTGKTMCTEGCVDGFCYPACRIPCPEGCLRCKRMLCENCTLCESHLYGQSCQYSCFEKCNGYACGIQGNCSQDKCMDGRYGKLCSKSCKPRYESCHQESGQCIKCRRGLFGDDCQNHCLLDCLSMEEDEMFRCRSGCTLCELQLHSEPKQDLACTEMKSQFNIVYGLTVAVMVIAFTNLFLYIKNAWPLKCRRWENAENTRVPDDRDSVIYRVPRRTISERSYRVPRRTSSERTNRNPENSDSLLDTRVPRRTISERSYRVPRRANSERANRNFEDSDSLLDTRVPRRTTSEVLYSIRAAGEDGVPLLGDQDSDTEEQLQVFKGHGQGADSKQPSSKMDAET